MVSMSQRQVNQAQDKNRMGRWHQIREMQPMALGEAATAVERVGRWRMVGGLRSAHAKH